MRSYDARSTHGFNCRSVLRVSDFLASAAGRATTSRTACSMRMPDLGLSSPAATAATALRLTSLARLATGRRVEAVSSSIMA